MAAVAMAGVRIVAFGSPFETIIRLDQLVVTLLCGIWGLVLEREVLKALPVWMTIVALSAVWPGHALDLTATGVLFGNVLLARYWTPGSRPASIDGS